MSTSVFDHTFTLVGADGLEHRYEVMLHSATAGQAIMWELYALASGPLAGAVGAMAGAGKIGDLLDADYSGLDFEGVGKGLGAAILQMPKLTPRLLAHTWRDQKRLFEANGGAFDAAYKGNYFELVKAVWEVVKANRFLPLSAISEIVSDVKEAKRQVEQEAASP